MKENVIGVKNAMIQKRGKGFLSAVCLFLAAGLFLSGCGRSEPDGENPGGANAANEMNEANGIHSANAVNETNGIEADETAESSGTAENSGITENSGAAETAGTETAGELQAILPESGTSCFFGITSDDFYFYVEDKFTIKGKEGVMVTGMTHNSPIYTDVEVDVLSASGRLEASVAEIETDGEETAEAAGPQTSAGLLLSGLSEAEINTGDLIVLRGMGVISDRVKADISLLDQEGGTQAAGLQAGQRIGILLFGKPVEAVVEQAFSEAEQNGEMREDGSMEVSLLLGEKTAFVNGQDVIVCDTEGQVIGAGYLYSE